MKGRSIQDSTSTGARGIDIMNVLDQCGPVGPSLLACLFDLLGQKHQSASGVRIDKPLILRIFSVTNTTQLGCAFGKDGWLQLVVSNHGIAKPNLQIPMAPRRARRLPM